MVSVFIFSDNSYSHNTNTDTGHHHTDVFDKPTIKGEIYQQTENGVGFNHDRVIGKSVRALTRDVIYC